MSIRDAIARHLYPTAFKNEQAYQRLKAEAIDAYHWLNGYPDAADTLRWLLDNDRNRNRGLNDKAVGDFPSRIDGFRAHLERRRERSAA